MTSKRQKSIETRHTEIKTRIKQLRSDMKSIKRPKSIIISTFLLISNIPTTFNNVFD